MLSSRIYPYHRTSLSRQVRSRSSSSRSSGSSGSCVLDDGFGAKDLGELREIPGALDEEVWEELWMFGEDWIMLLFGGNHR